MALIESDGKRNRKVAGKSWNVSLIFNARQFLLAVAGNCHREYAIKADVPLLDGLDSE